MKNLSAALIPIVCMLMLCSRHVFAIDAAPPISDREIVERLTRLEEGQNALRAEIRAQADATKQLREDMNKQFDRIDAQFDRVVNIMLGIFGAFAALCGGTIWFALWDRRTMIRPFEDKAKKIEDATSENQTRIHTLIEAFKALSKSDEKVANVLKKFNLL